MDANLPTGLVALTLSALLAEVLREQSADRDFPALLVANMALLPFVRPK
ncbi:MAG TPA: hypothetical protein VFD74_04145 [Thermoleophilia bacterium]|nr:hypothetical protein [Thermoleophilia bacterium]